MKQPNIIVFMTDHQRGDTVLPGSPVITPNLDRFREQAVTFSNSWCPSPHCCPSRATFFSGLYPSEHGIWNNVDVSNALSHHLFDDVRLFSEDLADAGYRLNFSGKWHVSSERGPDSYGFELLRHKTRSTRRTQIAQTSRSGIAMRAKSSISVTSRARKVESSAPATRLTLSTA